MLCAKKYGEILSCTHVEFDVFRRVRMPDITRSMGVYGDVVPGARAFAKLHRRV